MSEWINSYLYFLFKLKRDEYPDVLRLSIIIKFEFDFFILKMNSSQESLFELWNKVRLNEISLGNEFRFKGFSFSFVF